jgi:hypothetical protein
MGILGSRSIRRTIACALRDFVPAERASPGCDGAVLVVTIAEKFPERVMQKASQYAPSADGSRAGVRGVTIIFSEIGFRMKTLMNPRNTHRG